jgi:hypothetical protein
MGTPWVGCWLHPDAGGAGIIRDEMGTARTGWHRRQGLSGWCDRRGGLVAKARGLGVGATGKRRRSAMIWGQLTPRAMAKSSMLSQ